MYMTRLNKMVIEIRLKNTHTKMGETYSDSFKSSFPGCIFKPRYINFGPHQAKAPVTNPTHVNPADDSINERFLTRSKQETNFAFSIAKC